MFERTNQMTESKSTVVFYHANCADGLLAAHIAYKFFEAESKTEGTSLALIDFVPIQYGNPLPYDISGLDVYILDFSFPPQQMKEIIEKAMKVVWLDHHKSAIEAFTANSSMFSEYGQDEFEYHLSMEKSGAMLAFEYFFPEALVIPLSVQFVDDGIVTGKQIGRAHV